MATYDQRGQTVGVQQNADQITNVYAAPASALSRHDLDNRRRMLHRMGSEVEQRLQTLLHGAAWMRLGFEERPDAVPGQWSQASLPTAQRAEERRAQLLNAYVLRMFRRRRADARFPADRTVHWLAWLAGALDRRSQVTFYLEHLQPVWLPTTRDRRRYALVDRLGWAVIFGLVFGVTLGLVYWSIYGPKLGLLTSVCAALAIGLGSAASVGLFGGKRERRTTAGRSWLHRDLAHLRNIGLGMLVGSVNVALFLMIDLLTAGGLGPSFIWLVFLGTVPQMGMLSVLTGGPSFGPRWIVPVDNVGWGPRHGRTGGGAHLRRLSGPCGGVHLHAPCRRRLHVRPPTGAGAFREARARAALAGPLVARGDRAGGQGLSWSCRAGGETDAGYRGCRSVGTGRGAARRAAGARRLGSARRRAGGRAELS